MKPTGDPGTSRSASTRAACADAVIPARDAWEESRRSQQLMGGPGGFMSSHDWRLGNHEVFPQNPRHFYPEKGLERSWGWGFFSNKHWMTHCDAIYAYVYIYMPCHLCRPCHASGDETRSSREAQQVWATALVSGLWHVGIHPSCFSSHQNVGYGAASNIGSLAEIWDAQGWFMMVYVMICHDVVKLES